MAILAAASILIIISSRSVAGNQPAGINQQESSRRPEIQTQRKRSSKAIAGSSSRQEHSEAIQQAATANTILCDKDLHVNDPVYCCNSNWLEYIYIYMCDNNKHTTHYEKMIYVHIEGSSLLQARKGNHHQ